jgi:hypothetical protein
VGGRQLLVPVTASQRPDHIFVTSVPCRQLTLKEWRLDAWPSSGLSNRCDQRRLQTVDGIL